MTGLEYLLKMADWQLFGTFTWRPSKLGTIRSREAQVDEFLRARASHEHLSLSEMPLVIRWEVGEIGELPHCHFLIDGFPHNRINKRETHTWNALWYHDYGLARVRPFNYSLRGKVAAYLTVEPNSYEIGKFNSADRLVINEAAWERWKRLTRTSFTVAPST